MKRQPEGIPTGGQFATDRKPEPTGTLAVATNPNWELGGDMYADIHTARNGNTEVTITDDMRSEQLQIKSAWHFSGHGHVEINYRSLDIASAQRVAAEVMAENNAEHGTPAVAGASTPYGKIMACDTWAPGMERIATDRLKMPIYKLSAQRNAMVPEHLRAKEGLYISGAVPVLYGSAAADSNLARDLLPEFKKSHPTDYFRLISRRPELLADAPVEDR